MNILCDDATMNGLLEKMNIDSDENDIARIDKLLETYPEDPRLYFLKGSCLAGDQQLIEAHQAFQRAVDIAPDYTIARFQLGFFQLTSGESNNALKTWARLDSLPDDNYLKVFAIGLRHLIRDEFEDCITTLRNGISLNMENQPLNNDMQLIINECHALLKNTPHKGQVSPQQDKGITSATSTLLGQFSNTDTKH